MNDSSLYTQANDIAKKATIRTNYVAKKKLSINYIKYRFNRPILKLITTFQNRKFKPAPWLTPASINIFDSILDQSMIGLEYGSGSSTLFFAPRLKVLESIEHHNAWYQKVQGMIESAGLSNVHLHLVPNKHGSSYEPFDIPDGSLRVKHWYADYFSKVLEFPDDHFDFVLIDGRARVECLLNSIDKLKSGGILALDNSERSRYQPVFRILADWNRIDTTNGLTDTTIWFKP